MDEEELEQPSSKINVSSFFERVDSVEKVANNALSRANANLGIISNQKLIINSLNVTIEAMETKIRDIANYIIIEKKLEKDVAEDRALEEQDRLQKQAMVERADTIMGEPGPQGEQGQPAEQQKGGSLLGTLLRLGIGAFALKFLWPALLPLLKGSLAALGKVVFSKLGAGIGIAVGGTLLSLPLLRRFKDPFQKKSEELGENTGKFVAGKVNSIDEKGNVDTSSGGKLVNESNVDINDKNVDNLEDTLIEKDLVPAESFSEYQNRTRNESEEEKEGASEGKIEMITYTRKTKSRTGKSSTQAKVVKGGRLDSLTKGEIVDLYAELHKRYNGQGEELSRDEQIDYEQRVPNLMWAKYGVHSGSIESVLSGGVSLDPFVTDRFKQEDVEPIKGENLDLSSNDVDSDMTQAIAKTNERIDNLIGGENKEQNNGNLVSANKPNVTEATLKLASAPLPFVKVIKNNQLSTSPKSYNGLPPEIAAMIS